MLFLHTFGLIQDQDFSQRLVLLTYDLLSYQHCIQVWFFHQFINIYYFGFTILVKIIPNLYCCAYSFPDTFIVYAHLYFYLFFLISLTHSAAIRSNKINDSSIFEVLKFYSFACISCLINSSLSLIIMTHHAPITSFLTEDSQAAITFPDFIHFWIFAQNGYSTVSVDGSPSTPSVLIILTTRPLFPLYHFLWLCILKIILAFFFSLAMFVRSLFYFICACCISVWDVECAINHFFEIIWGMIIIIGYSIFITIPGFH